MLDLDTTKELIAFFEQKKMWSTTSIKRVLTDLLLGKPVPEVDQASEQDTVAVDASA